MAPKSRLVTLPSWLPQLCIDATHLGLLSICMLLKPPFLLVANLGILLHSSPFSKGLATIPVAAVAAGQISQLLAESTDCSACLLAAPFLCLLDTCSTSSQQPGGVEAEEETGGEVVDRDELEDAIEMNGNETVRFGGGGEVVDSEDWDLS